MSKNTLLIAVTAGLFAATGALAQTSSGNSSNATDTPTASPMQDSTTAPSTHKAKKHHTSSHAPSTGKKTPDQTTGNGAGASENGQSK
jgi:hypothetical protein